MLIRYIAVFDNRHRIDDDYRHFYQQVFEAENLEMAMTVAKNHRHATHYGDTVLFVMTVEQAEAECRDYKSRTYFNPWVANWIERNKICIELEEIASGKILLRASK